MLYAYVFRTHDTFINLHWDKKKKYLGLGTWKPVLGVRKTNAQTSLRISVDWSAPFSFAFWEVSFLELLQVKFQFSS